ncbi:hypothetical protein NUSPORA_01012 [Nucleospora cyclopteri]
MTNARKILKKPWKSERVKRRTESINYSRKREIKEMRKIRIKAEREIIEEIKRNKKEYFKKYNK